MYKNPHESSKTSVTLREITAETVRSITDLKVSKEQEALVVTENKPAITREQQSNAENNFNKASYLS